MYSKKSAISAQTGTQRRLKPFRRNRSGPPFFWNIFKMKGYRGKTNTSCSGQGLAAGLGGRADFSGLETNFSTATGMRYGVPTFANRKGQEWKSG